MLVSIKDFLVPYSEKVDEFVEPAITWLIEFFSKGYNVLYLAIAIILALVMISGLITCLRKFPKFFFILLIVLSIISTLWYFLIYK